MRRTGARRRSEIPADVLAALHRGEIETVNLVECLAIDIEVLAQAVVPDLAGVARALQGEGVMARTRGMGDALRGHARLEELAGHASDTVRGWACYAIVADPDPDLSLRARLDSARPFAVDSHMAVREMAWAAARPFFVDDLRETFRLLESWVADDHEHARRFAVEGTRPRGVWCRHIEALKRDPEPGLLLLEPLRSDPSRYVQNAVANWLNDASKSQPEWVREVCARWERESGTRETAYIVRRALRTLRKKA